MRITGGVGLDLIIDAVGPSSFRKDYAILRSGGRLVMYGLSEVQTGEQARHPGGRCAAWRGCRWRRCRGGGACR